MRSLLLCPICKRPVDPDLSPAAPFCSSRCRTIDLGRWLNEEYSVPHLSEDEEEEEPAP